MSVLPVHDTVDGNADYGGTAFNEFYGLDVAPRLGSGDDRGFSNHKPENSRPNNFRHGYPGTVFPRGHPLVAPVDFVVSTADRVLGGVCVFGAILGVVAGGHDD